MTSFKYDLIRSKRKTISIIIKNQRITVRAPLKYSTALIKKFLEQKSDWIIKKLNSQLNNSKIFANLLTYDQYAYFGAIYIPQIEPNFKRIQFENDRILIPQKLSSKACLKRFFVKLAKDYLQDRLDIMAEKYNFKYSAFLITNAKTKWGSCTSSNLLRLNWRLIMLDPQLIDYVILHELCHTKYHNHSKDFWDLLISLNPQAKQLQKLLKNYSLYMELFRFTK